MGLLATSGSGAYIGIDKKAVIKIVDPYTIDITPSFSNRRLIEQLVHPEDSLVAPGSKPTRPIGTGPFKFVSYQRNRQIVVERWSGYWGAKAKLQRLTFKFVPDANARALALESGAVQAAFGVPRESAASVGSHGGLRIVHSPVGAYEALYFDIRGASGFDLGQDPAVRQAVELGIDRRVIVKDVWRGNATVIQTMIPPTILGTYARLVRGFRYSIAQAEKVLDQAGWQVGGDGIRTKSGRRLSLTMVVGFPNPTSTGRCPTPFRRCFVRSRGVRKLHRARRKPAICSEIALMHSTRLRSRFETSRIGGKGRVMAGAGIQSPLGAVVPEPVPTARRGRGGSDGCDPGEGCGVRARQ